MSIYVRVKRRNQTMFIYTEPAETVDALKAKISQIVKVPAAEMRLYADLDSTTRVMPDKETLEKLYVQPEQELALVFKLEGLLRVRPPPRHQMPLAPCAPRFRSHACAGLRVTRAQQRLAAGGLGCAD
jgi:hypothetical protein